MEALAQFCGCSREILEPFKALVRIHYEELFLETDLQGKSFQQRFEEVMHRYPILRQKCGAFSDSSMS